MDALPKPLAQKLLSGMNWALLDELLKHRQEYLIHTLASQKPMEEMQEVWGKLAEDRWLQGLKAFAENTLKA